MTEHLEFAKSLADEAGEIMLQYFQVGVESTAKTYEGNTPVRLYTSSIPTMQ